MLANRLAPHIVYKRVLCIRDEFNHLLGLHANLAGLIQRGTLINTVLTPGACEISKNEKGHARNRQR